MEATYIGVDPGRDGAIAIMDTRGVVSGIALPEWDPAWPGVVLTPPFELELRESVAGLVRGRVVIAIERTIPRSKGSGAVVAVAASAGAWASRLFQLCRPVATGPPILAKPFPQQWHARVFGERAAKGQSKARSRQVATVLAASSLTLLYPFRNRTQVLHDGVADAICLAEYARQEGVRAAVLETAK